MPNKLIITSVDGGFSAQIEIDGNLQAIKNFDCNSNPVIKQGGSCPTNGNPLFQICDDKGTKSSAVGKDCFILDGTPVPEDDIFTIISGICPNEEGTGDLATEATQLEVLDCIKDLKDLEVPAETKHNNYVGGGTETIVGVYSISVTKTSKAGVVLISGDNGTDYPLDVNGENFSDTTRDKDYLSDYTITATGGATYKIHTIV